MFRFFVFVALFISSTASAHELASKSTTFFADEAVPLGLLFQAGGRVQGSFTRAITQNDEEILVLPGSVLVGPSLRIGVETRRLTTVMDVNYLLGGSQVSVPQHQLDTGVTVLGHGPNGLRLGGYGLASVLKSDVYSGLGGQFGVELGWNKRSGDGGLFSLSARGGCGPTVRRFQISDQYDDSNVLVISQVPSLSCSVGIGVSVGGSTGS